MSSTKHNSENYDKKNSEILKRLGLVILMAVTIILSFILLKGCVSNIIKNRNSRVASKDLSSVLLKAGKSYYVNNNYYLPKYEGDCSSVDLLTLSQQGLIDRTNYVSCDNEQTYVKVCKISDDKYQYIPFLYCENEITEKKYSTWVVGNKNSLISDSTDIRYLFQVEYLDDASSVLGPIETMWEDEITYEHYRLVDLSKYYRYRDLQYIWNVKTTNYYPSNTSDSTSISEYYIESPAEGYTNKSNQNNSVAKYFSTTSEKIYWVDANGVKETASQAPDNEYVYKDNPVSNVKYRTRTWIETSKPVETVPKELWICKSPGTQNQYVSDLPCEKQIVNPNYTVTLNHVYSCDGGKSDVGKDGKCYKCSDGQGLKSTNDSCGYYSSWSVYTKEACDKANEDICESESSIEYNWYKLKDNSKKVYYPSGSKKASEEKAYYAEAPNDNLIRDEETVTTGWKWYKSTETQTTTYYTTAPLLGATRTSKSRWTDFSGWTTIKPESLSPNGVREIQTKVRIDLRKITSSANAKWIVFNEDYLTQEELFKKLQAKGYKVNSLEEIILSGELRYKTKILTRDIEVK